MDVPIHIFNELLVQRFQLILSLVVCSPGVPSLTEEQLDSMCPSAAAIAAIVKPGMKFFDVSPASTVTVA